MPLPHWLGRLNRRLTNPILGRIVVHVPGFWILRHVGRRTGRPYATPVMVFGRGGHRLIAMTYGPGTDWAKNVVAAGGCRIERRGQGLRLASPRIFVDPLRAGVPRPVRWALAVLRSSDFLELRVVAEP